MTMRDMFNVPKDPHPDEPDELTPDTLPLDDIERPHDGARGDAPADTAAGSVDDTTPETSPEKDLDEPGDADRTPRP